MDSMETLLRSSQLEGENAAYLEALYEDYLDNPTAIAPQWKSYFDSLGIGNSLDARHSSVRAAFLNLAQQPKQFEAAVGSGVDIDKLQKVIKLLNAFRLQGHLEAQLDPLRLKAPNYVKALHYETYGLTVSDLDQVWPVQGLPAKPLKVVLEDLRKLYCGSIGFECAYIDDEIRREWLQQKIEAPRAALSHEEQQWLLARLIAADGLEKYLGTRYVGQKRFSLEGGDSLIALMDKLIHQSCDDGVKEIVIAMAHRGRLNVLVNVMGKAPKDLFAEFEGRRDESLLAGDVKYHKGFSSDIKTQGGMLHLALAFNPSHLEIVSPVAEGSVHARQVRRGNNQDQVFAIHIHGDASFAGQGCVYETLNMSETRGYGNGGAVHIVVNNQVGFTTSNPLDARSTPYCTDIAKTFAAPIFHVNGDDPEAVLFVAELALKYRETFKRDVFIDLVCYRRHGHNEADEPSATQPLMYQVIKSLPVVWKQYAEKLKREGIIDDAGIDKAQQDYKQCLEAGNPVQEIIESGVNTKYTVNWAPYLQQTWEAPYVAVEPLKKLSTLGTALAKLPQDFVVQAQVNKTLQDRIKMTAAELPVNWGYAEIMAYATLLERGISVRLSGEDVGRGTFAHRHAVLHDQKTDSTHIPLNQVVQGQAKFTVIDSLLSEEAVLGFEYGYAGSSPEGLTIWEAQFGDFVNGAQVIIDQFISSGEEKWGRLCGLVLLLPHGQEGMGPEHSSARLERFLQLCAHENMQVCAPTTPAQIYHLLRRQALRNYRKPLIIMSPKSLLRHPLVTSTLADLAEGTFFNVLPETDALNAKNVRRVVICQGKVYYDLLSKRREQKLEDIALIRLEQMYPFPAEEVKKVFASYAHVKDWVWCQEEPRNQGAWLSVAEPISAVLPVGCSLNYVGRKDYSSPAVGYASLFHEEQSALINQALMLKS